LSRLIAREENLGLIHCIKMTRICPPISHLLFADDVIVFSKAKPIEARVILKCLTTYSSWYGQHINMSKSAIFFGRNCKSTAKEAVNSILHLALLPSKAKYLGIPLFMHRRKKDSFIDLKYKILARISGWKARLLSQAARTTLVKSVINAIPTYLMSLFLLPESLCASINSCIRKFWWGYPQDKKHGLSLLAWANICKPKSLGGIGIRSMEDMNNSLLARLGWKMVSNQPHLWVDSLRGKYLKHGVYFLTAPFNSVSFWLWKGLQKNRKVVEKGACISISSGQNVDIWNNPWIPLMPNFKPILHENLVGFLLILLQILFLQMVMTGTLHYYMTSLSLPRCRISLAYICLPLLVLISGAGFTLPLGSSWFLLLMSFPCLWEVGLLLFQLKLGLLFGV
jgi:hypothetical protein